MGGENHVARGCPIDGEGSSPRGRGKPLFKRIMRFYEGLIPAWAGKTVPPVTLPGYQGAHPRVGGENWFHARVSQALRGSSPRGRGKPSVRLRKCTPRGLIPAWAGKTRLGTLTTSRSRAHPRVGGENYLSLPFFTLFTWLIPAWAGKTLGRASAPSSEPAHPRVGGENAHGHGRRHRRRGSSPRGRGKPHGARLAPGVSGLIPAWAGKTCKSNPYVLGVRAHPRVGGENLFTSHPA